MSDDEHVHETKSGAARPNSCESRAKFSDDNLRRRRVHVEFPLSIFFTIPSDSARLADIERHTATELELRVSLERFIDQNRDIDESSPHGISSFEPFYIFSRLKKVLYSHFC